MTTPEIRVSGDRLSTVDLEVRCTQCGEEFKIEAPRAGFNSWLHGELIQKALPELAKEERELLVSGTCSDCFDKLFPPWEETK